ncbi:MAG: hypothetical protein HDQ87_12010 [Clostridia bacterium]|nr:hypothetical protein [Clostridia bacterium]
MKPYDEMRILTYGLSEASEQELRERIPVLEGPSYASFDFSGHDGWDSLKWYKALAVFCNPSPEVRLVPYAPPYIVLRGIDQLRQIVCPPADALVLLVQPPGMPEADFPHLDADLPKKINNRALTKTARILEKAQTPALLHLDGMLPVWVEETFAGGCILMDFTVCGSGTKTDVLKITAQRLKDYAPDGPRFETLCQPSFPLTDKQADEAGLSEADLKAAPSLADALKKFAEWNDSDLPVVVWSSEETADAFLRPERPESEQLPPKTLILDLGNLSARLYPAHFIKEAFTPHGIARLAGANKADLDAMEKLTKMLLSGLSDRYYTSFTYFGQLMDLYRPEALEALRESQRTAAGTDESGTSAVGGEPAADGQPAEAAEGKAPSAEESKDAD